MDLSSKFSASKKTDLAVSGELRKAGSARQTTQIYKGHENFEMELQGVTNMHLTYPANFNLLLSVGKCRRKFENHKDDEKRATSLQAVTR